MRHEEKRRCGANAKSTGLPCQRFPMENGRCYFHGGVVKISKNRNQFVKGNTASLTHGIYSERIFEDEFEIYENVSLGTIDEESKMLRILLRRRYGDLRMFEELRTMDGEDLTKKIKQLEERLRMLEEERRRIEGGPPY